MSAEKAKLGFLSNNMLKLIAAALMVCDHAGMLLFPEVPVLRYIGRLAFPIFAYLIAEGAKYTRNRFRYFLTMASFAAVIQVGYSVFTQSLEMSVMVTFTLSLAIIFAIDFFKKEIFEEELSLPRLIGGAALTFVAVLAAAMLGILADIDYHFTGCLLPVFPALLTTPRVKAPPKVFRILDTKWCRVAALAVGMLLLVADHGVLQWYGYCALPLLLLYSEKRGKWKMKYFFYVFYPLHLVVLYVIAAVIK